jgi:hypothetical protein
VLKPQTIAEQILFSTLRIEAHGPGTSVSIGTGFFFAVHPPERPDLQLLLLVTNKHVVGGSDRFNTVMHTKGEDDHPIGTKAITINARLGDGWVGHEKAEVDLCALPMGPIMQGPMDGKAFVRAIEPNIMMSDEQLLGLDAIEEVVMYGYPNGLWDATNDLPLIRRGITASHPGLDYLVEGVATTVVDMACFPGSSGSPIFVLNNGAYANKSGGMAIGQRLIFLGALFAGPQYLNDGRIVIKDVPTATQPVAVTPMMMNLGYLIKAREVAALASSIIAKIPLPPSPNK